MIRLPRVFHMTKLPQPASMRSWPAVRNAFSTSEDKDIRYYIREQLIYRNNRFKRVPKVDFVTITAPIISAGLILHGYNAAGIIGLAFWSAWMLARIKSISRIKQTVSELYYDPSTRLVTLHLNEAGKDPIVTRVHQVDFEPPVHLSAKIAKITVKVNDRQRDSDPKSGNSKSYDMFVFTDQPMVLNKSLFIALTSKNLEELDKYELFSEDKPTN